MRTKRCTRCVISLDYPGVTADSRGICNLCRAHVPETQKVLGEKALEREFKKYRGKGEYDCLLAFSGGKDSTYVLYRLVKRYKLKVLAVTGDDYLASRQAWRNRFAATKKLGVDHLIIRYDWNLYRHVYRAAIVKSGLRPRAINLVHNLMHEKAIFETLERYRIPLLVTGNSEDELELFREWEQKLGFKRRGSLPFDYWNNWRSAYVKVLREILPQRLQSRIPDIVWREPRRNNSAARAKHLPFFRYEKFDVRKNIKTIENKLGWVLPHDVGGTETDSAGLQFDVHLYRKLHGGEAYAAEVSKLVREGTITRAIALKAVRFDGRSIVRRFFREFRLSYRSSHPERCTPLLTKWLDLFLPIR